MLALGDIELLPPLDERGVRGELSRETGPNLGSNLPICSTRAVGRVTACSAALASALARGLELRLG